MDPVDRLLKTAVSALPDEQKADILRERSEDSLSEIAEKEAQVGPVAHFRQLAANGAITFFLPMSWVDGAEDTRH